MPTKNWKITPPKSLGGAFFQGHGGVRGVKYIAAQYFALVTDGEYLYAGGCTLDVLPRPLIHKWHIPTMMLVGQFISTVEDQIYSRLFCLASGAIWAARRRSPVFPYYDGYLDRIQTSDMTATVEDVIDSEIVYVPRHFGSVITARGASTWYTIEDDETVTSVSNAYAVVTAEYTVAENWGAGSAYRLRLEISAAKSMSVSETSFLWDMKYAYKVVRKSDSVSNSLTVYAQQVSTTSAPQNDPAFSKSWTSTLTTGTVTVGPYNYKNVAWSFGSTGSVAAPYPDMTYSEDGYYAEVGQKFNMWGMYNFYNIVSNKFTLIYTTYTWPYSFWDTLPPRILKYDGGYWYGGRSVTVLNKSGPIIINTHFALNPDGKNFASLANIVRLLKQWNLPVNGRDVQSPLSGLLPSSTSIGDMAVYNDGTHDYFFICGHVRWAQQQRYSGYIIQLRIEDLIAAGPIDVAPNNQSYTYDTFKASVRHVAYRERR